MKKYIYPLFALLMGLTFLGCGQQTKQTSTEFTANEQEEKIGILLVNHGSHSETWRGALLDLEAAVKDSLLSHPQIGKVTTAFMEYTEPSIATRLKEFDQENYSDVILVPVFLTVSPHSFDDIPTIIGQKEDPQSKEMLKLEKIERYTPQAQTHIAPLLDFTEVLQQNVLHRARSISTDPANEGLVLVAYGDETYTKEWIELLYGVGEHVKDSIGIEQYAYSWCGHIAHYNPDSVTVPINAMLAQKEQAVVVPVLVAHDEMFQIKIIGDGIAAVPDNQERVTYKPDAILPDRNVENWVIQIATHFTDSISAKKSLALNE